VAPLRPSLFRACGREVRPTPRYATGHFGYHPPSLTGVIQAGAERRDARPMIRSILLVLALSLSAPAMAADGAAVYK